MIRTGLGLLLLACWLPAAEPGNADRMPRIAIVIDDLGYQPANDRAVLELDRRVAVAIIPDGPLAPALAAEAGAQQRDVLIHLPLAGNGDCNGRIQCLQPEQSLREVANHLLWALDRVAPAVGINNHQGSRYTADSAAVRRLVTAVSLVSRLRDRPLFVLDSRTSPASRLESAARRARLHSMRRHVFLDHRRDEVSMAQAWQALLERARNHGRAIAIGHPHPETVAFLQRAIEMLDANGVALVAISSIAAAPGDE